MVDTTLGIAESLYAASDELYLTYADGSFSSDAVADTTWEAGNADRAIKVVTAGIDAIPGNITEFSIDNSSHFARRQDMPDTIPVFYAPDDTKLDIETLGLPLDPSVPAGTGLDVFLQQRQREASRFTRHKAVALRMAEWGAAKVRADTIQTYAQGAENPMRHVQKVSVESYGHAGNAFTFYTALDMVTRKPTEVNFQTGGRSFLEIMSAPLTDEALRDVRTIAHAVIDLAKGNGLQRYLDTRSPARNNMEPSPRSPRSMRN